MSGAELRAWAMSPGAVMAGTPDDSDLPARAVRILDERDASHQVQFGHLPGTVADCSQPSRAEALPQAMIAARQGQPGIWRGTTQELADLIRRRAPWINASVTGPDPEVGKARERLALEMAQAHAGILPHAGIVP